MVVARDWGGGQGRALFNGCRVSVREDKKKSLEIHKFLTTML